ncbi:MAG: hypothetical protein JNL65_01950 [Saprospiraceae bacterium]|nr:hypothetical protein [Saprospiraceae bacterium]HRG69659.1 hypothetical protein [Saprospiraceae bacterium]
MKRFSIVWCLCLLIACKEIKTEKKTMVGTYAVHLELDSKSFDKQSVKDSVSQALNKAKEEISKAQSEFAQQMDTSTIDTSTAEGKMEFIAKSFAKSLSSFGKDLGELGIMMGEAAGDIAVNAMDMTEELIQKIKMDVELRADGKMVSSSAFVKNIQFMGSNWEVKDDQFIFTNSENQHKHQYKITELTENGFVLVQDKYRLIFTRKNAN